MEKKTLLEAVKSWDMQGIVAGIIILLSAMTAVMGDVKLSVGIGMVFAVFCLMNSMGKDLMELCNELVEEEMD